MGFASGSPLIGSGGTGWKAQLNVTRSRVNERSRGTAESARADRRPRSDGSFDVDTDVTGAA